MGYLLRSLRKKRSLADSLGWDVNFGFYMWYIGFPEKLSLSQQDDKMIAFSYKQNNNLNGVTEHS